MSDVKNTEFITQSYYPSSPTPTTFSTFVIIILYLQLLSDKCLLFPDIILDVSTRVSNYLDIIISCLVSTVLPNWNVFWSIQYSCCL